MEEIPNDSIFCPECGARQEVSRAGSFANTGAVGPVSYTHLRAHETLR